MTSSGSGKSRALFVSKEPPPAATDLGGPEWERKLIRELRNRHYQWRTEQAYRMWAGRWVRWLTAERRQVGNVFQAGEVEVRDFLSDLATRQRVAVATERFLLRSSLVDRVLPSVFPG